MKPRVCSRPSPDHETDTLYVECVALRDSEIARSMCRFQVR